MVQNASILVVEDERDLAEMLAYNLRKAGYRVSVAHDGLEAISQIKSNPPDLVVLDVMLPGMSGMEIARQVRTGPTTATLPILMLTARVDEADQIAGLSIGADDYVAKPFSMKVVLARVEALLRRAAVGPDAASNTIAVGLMAVEMPNHRVTVDGEELKLTLTEFKIVVAMLQSPRRVMSRQDLIARVMGPGIVVTARTIDVHVASIRKKMGRRGGMIRTIRGVGYQITDEDESPAEAAGVLQAV